ncbi:MAG: hypothetical protein Q7R52_04685 [archaeon]|nr:hypothetical protein [archaeon]
MKNKKFMLIFASLFLLITSISLISSLTLSSVNSENVEPGKIGTINLELKNTLNEDITDVSIDLDLTKLPFSFESDGGETDIREGKTEKFLFEIKTLSDAKTGNYEVPYTINYYNINDTIQTKKGSFMITVKANPELVYSTTLENPVEGQRGKIKFKIVNKGFGDAKFVSIKISPEGYTLFSEDSIYIGTIASDDFETTSIDVLFKNENAYLNAQVEYRDFDNNKLTKNINIPLNVYSKERALELGIIKKDNTWMYVLGVGVILIFWIIRRKLKKRKRLSTAQGR